MTEELRGTVRKIIFSSDDGRFCVFLLEDKESRKIMTAAYRGPAPMWVSRCCFGDVGNGIPVLACSSSAAVWRM